jgi:asparagine synthase (glutamine-hydrolysing)
MSGIFGFADPKAETELQPLVGQMAAVMSHRPWYVTEWAVDDTCRAAFGRLGIGIFNQNQQPVWNSDRTVAIAWAGEVYNLPGRTDNKTDEQRLLELYHEKGPNFVKELNGAFLIGIWDKLQGRLMLANDRFGFYPLYYASYAGRLSYAPEVKGVLCDIRIPKTLDIIAQAQYMRFQQLLGDRTFFEHVKRLPRSSILLYKMTSGDVNLQEYWTYDDIPYRPKITFQDAAAEVGHLFRMAANRLSSDVYRPGVFLSGGLDSRAILGVTRRRPIATFTYGARDSRDVYYARKISKAAGSNHHWFDLSDGNWVKENADFHLTLTEGFHSWMHAHSITMLPAVREKIDVNLTGWDGAAVIGHPSMIEKVKVEALDEPALLVRFYHLLTNYHTWPSLTESEERLLYTPSALMEIQGLAFESFKQEMEKYYRYRPDVREDYFFYDNHCLRLTHNMIVFGRSHVEFRFPFFDRDLFDLVYSLQPSFRTNQKLYFSVIQREAPHLAKIPYDKDEMLPTDRRWKRELHGLGVKVRSRIHRHIKVLSERKTLYADYESYLRNELREWAEEILYSDSLRQRGIFNQDFLRSLMGRHVSGQEEWTIGKIAPVMTYEMMLRHFNL